MNIHIYVYWLLVWNMTFRTVHLVGNNNPNWRTHFFKEGFTPPTKWYVYIYNIYIYMCYNAATLVVQCWFFRVVQWWRVDPSQEMSHQFFLMWSQQDRCRTWFSFCFAMMASPHAPWCSMCGCLFIDFRSNIYCPKMTQSSWYTHRQIYIYIYPYGSKYLLRKCLGYDLGGDLYLLRKCLDP